MTRPFVFTVALATLIAGCTQAEDQPVEPVGADSAAMDHGSMDHGAMGHGGMDASGDDAAGPSTDLPSETVTLSNGLELSGGYIMAPLKGRDVAAGYFAIRNPGEVDMALVEASTPIAETVELHTHLMDEGVMKMREVSSIPFPAGQTVTLEPGGLHLMLFGFAVEAGQSETDVAFEFADGETATVTLPIRERG